MTRSQKWVVFSNNLGAGLFVPVLSLFLLSHGCTLQTLAAAMGVNSTVALLFVAPSGLFADMYGRKKALYLSCFFTAAGFLLLYLSKSLLALFAGMALYGLGNAFVSGSLDSLVLEDCLKRRGDKSLSSAAGTNLTLQCGGILAGSLLGGFLPETKGYLYHLLLRLLLLGLTALLICRFLKETPRERESRASLKSQLTAVAASLRAQKTLFAVLLCVLGSSMALFAFRTYWQPRFSTLLQSDDNSLLGLLCACGYGGNMLGSFLSSKAPMESGKHRWGRYFGFLGLMGLFLCALALQKTVPGFIVCYLGIMLCLGVANVPEQTLLNSLSPNETRASLLCLASLFFQLAGIFTSLLCTALVLKIDVTGVMLATGLISIAVIGAGAVLLRFLQRKGPVAVG